MAVISLQNFAVLLIISIYCLVGVAKSAPALPTFSSASDSGEAVVVTMKKSAVAVPVEQEVKVEQASSSSSSSLRDEISLPPGGSPMVKQLPPLVIGNVDFDYDHTTNIELALSFGGYYSVHTGYLDNDKLGFHVQLPPPPQ